MMMLKIARLLKTSPNLSTPIRHVNSQRKSFEFLMPYA